MKRKTAALALAFVLTFSLAGCGGNDQKTGDGGSGTKTEDNTEKKRVPKIIKDALAVIDVYESGKTADKVSGRLISPKLSLSSTTEMPMKRAESCSQLRTIPMRHTKI